jgi:hypothetical protein
MSKNVVDFGSFKEAMVAKLKAEADYFAHMDRLLALTEILAPTVRAMHETGATDKEVTCVLRHAADVADGREPF